MDFLISARRHIPNIEKYGPLTHVQWMSYSDHILGEGVPDVVIHWIAFRWLWRSDIRLNELGHNFFRMFLRHFTSMGFGVILLEYVIVDLIDRCQIEHLAAAWYFINPGISFFWAMIFVFSATGLIPKLLSWNVYMPETISWSDNTRNFI
jgi:hypothetical protein